MGRLDRVLEYCRNFPKFYVYAIVGHDGRPLYIGSSESPERRAIAHGREGFEVLDTYPDKRMMLDAERQYIEYLKPPRNVRYNTMPAAYPLNE